MRVEINLLAWRAKARERRRRHFHFGLLLAGVIGIGSGASQAFVAQQQLSAQQQRNTHIEARLTELMRDTRLVSDYAAAAGRADERIEALSLLQNARGQTVELFSQLVGSHQEGVQYTRLARQEGLLSLTGVADDSRRVFAQLHSLAAALTLGVPVLSAMETEEPAPRQRFSLSIRQPFAKDVANSEVSQ